jgi:hypothetical protein
VQKFAQKMFQLPHKIEKNKNKNKNKNKSMISM